MDTKHILNLYSCLKIILVLTLMFEANIESLCSGSLGVNKVRQSKLCPGYNSPRGFPPAQIASYFSLHPQRGLSVAPSPRDHNGLSMKSRSQPNWHRQQCAQRPCQGLPATSHLFLSALRIQTAKGEGQGRGRGHYSHSLRQ